MLNSDRTNRFSCKELLYSKWAVLLFFVLSLMFTFFIGYALHTEEKEHLLDHNNHPTAKINSEIECSSTPTYKTKVHDNIAIIIGAGGFLLNVMLLVALLSYIKKRRLLKAEHEILTKNENRLQTLLASSTDGIHILDHNGRLIDYSRSFIDMLGYSPEEAAHLKVYDWDDNFSADELAKIISRVSNEILTFETRHRRKDGTIYDAEITAKPIMLNGENHIFCSGRDITERRKRIEELDLFHTLIDDSNDMVFIIRIEDGYIEYANKTAEEKIGYSLDEMRSIGVEGFRRPLKDGKEFSDHLQELKAVGSMIDYAIVIRKDGSEFLTETHVRASYYAGTDYNIAIARDITEHEEYKKNLKKMMTALQEREENLRKINEHLSELVKEESAKIIEKEKLLMQQSKMAAMGEMVGMIAHQWRQPLNAVSAAAIKLNMLSDVGTLTPQQLQETSIFIQQMSQKMSRTINDFMDFAKPDRKKESVRIKDILDGILKIIDAQLKTHSIALVTEVQEGMTLHTYKHELSHVLMNFISNARDAFDDKEIADKTITIRAYEEGENVIIEISDNAGGIDTSIMDRIFDPFFTTKSTEKGTGIGLYMSKKMIEEDLKGVISAVNKDSGALFKIELPKIV